MPRAKQTDDQILDEGERLFLEQAKAYFRDLRQTAQDAPLGQIINRVDAFVFQKGREFLQKTFQDIIQEQNDLLEKKKNSGSAPADANENISDTEPTKP
jgi:hypothetical protein